MEADLTNTIRAMEKENKIADGCLTCGGRTHNMYCMNKGVYCELHYEAGLAQQEIDMGLEQLKQKVALMSKPLYCPLVDNVNP